MSLFIIVPTFYNVYKVSNLDSAALQFVKEFKTKGEAVKWIHNSGEKGINYCIKEYLRK